MYIAPNSVVYLLRGVPLNKKYVHTVAYKTPAEQFNGFMNYKVKTASALQYVRDTGSLKVNFSCDDIYGCNYMVFQNTPYTNKYYYAFIDRISYVGNNASELFFTIDPIQSYWYDFEFLPSFVVREHSKTDNVTENLTPEPINPQSFVYRKVENTRGANLPFSTDNYRIVVGVTEQAVLQADNSWAFIPATSQINSNVFSGLMFNVYNNAESVAALLEVYVENQKENAVKVIYVCPHPNLCDSFGTIRRFFLDFNTEPPVEGYDDKDNILDFDVPYTNTIDGYTPRNRKLLTSQFHKIMLTDLNGQTSELATEYFVNAYQNESFMKFRIMMEHSATPELLFFPINYLGVDPKKNTMYGIVNNNISMGCASISNFDSWWAYNATKYNIKQTSNALGLVGGGVMLAGGIMAGNPTVAIAGGVSLANSFLNIASTINEAEIQEKEPNKLLTTSSGGSELTAGTYGVMLVYKSIHAEQARILDDFFDMFGYQTNRIKVPGFNNRPTYNYVKTEGCSIKPNAGSGMPSDAVENICTMLDNGITFWAKLQDVGDYSLRNDPID